MTSDIFRYCFFIFFFFSRWLDRYVISISDRDSQQQQKKKKVLLPTQWTRPQQCDCHHQQNNLPSWKHLQSVYYKIWKGLGGHRCRRNLCHKRLWCQLELPTVPEKTESSLIWHWNGCVLFWIDMETGFVPNFWVVLNATLFLLQMCVLFNWVCVQNRNLQRCKQYHWTTQAQRLRTGCIACTEAVNQDRLYFSAILI